MLSRRRWLDFILTVHPLKVGPKGALGYYGVNRGVFPRLKSFSRPKVVRAGRVQPGALMGGNDPATKPAQSQGLFPQQDGTSVAKVNRG